MRRSVLFAVVLGLALSLVVGGLSTIMVAAKPRLVVGGKNFTEQYIVGNMLSLLFKAHGFAVQERFGTGSTITRKGLTTGQTDLYPEYTGTAWAIYLKHDENVNDPEELYQRVKEEDLQKNGIVWLERAPLNNTYALAIRRDDVEKVGTTLADLAAYVNAHPGELTFGIDHEFYERSDGFFKMAEEYGMKVTKKDVRTMEVGLTFESIHRKQIDVAMVFATDGKLKKYDLVVLEDNQHFFPIYNLSVTINKDVLDKYPEIEDIVKPVFALLDNETMQALNYAVDAEGKPAIMVAEQFLKEHGFLK